MLQAVETRRSSKDVISKQTVLENRRKKHMESKSIELPQKEIAARRISTIQRVFRVSSFPGGGGAERCTCKSRFCFKNLIFSCSYNIFRC